MGAVDLSHSWTFFEGRWQAGNVPIMGSLTHAAWLASVVFDGARIFEGLAPDLDRHAQRVVDSARSLGLSPDRAADDIVALTREGATRFEEGAHLYVRPMFFGETGFFTADPSSTRFALVLSEVPVPRESTFTACASSFRRPSPSSAPTSAKASCLYPNVALAVNEARSRGFDTAVVFDPDGCVAELCTANLFVVDEGIVRTPVPNGTFLDGITRQRVIELLREAGHTVVEDTLRWDDLVRADELFSTGNFAKVSTCQRLEDRSLPEGPVGREARRLYFEFARQQPLHGADREHWRSG